MLSPFIRTTTNGGSEGKTSRITRDEAFRKYNELTSLPGKTPSELLCFLEARFFIKKYRTVLHNGYF